MLKLCDRGVGGEVIDYGEWQWQGEPGSERPQIVWFDNGEPFK